MLQTVKSLQLHELPYSHIIVEKGGLTEADGAWPMSGIISRVLESRSVGFHCLGTDFIVWALDLFNGEMVIEEECRT